MRNKISVYFTVFCLVISCALFGAENHPQLILHFDVNRTLFMLDPASQKTKADCVIHTLADKYEDRWDDRVLEPICYTDYIKEYVYPGIEAGNPTLKRIRKEQISQFLNFLDQTNHPFAKQARADFDRAYEKLEKQPTLILTAFYRLLDHLEKNHYDYSIVLRTFGMDLDVVMADIESQTRSDFFYARGEFKDGILRFEKPSNLKAIESIRDFYQFLKDHRNIAIHDDWAPWNRSGELQECGKPFPIDLSDNRVISLFFDDNVTVKPNSAKNIVNPRDVHTGNPIKAYDLIQKKRIFSVDTIEAIADESYFIHLVESASNPIN